MPVGVDRRWTVFGILICLGALACDRKRPDAPGDSFATERRQHCVAGEPVEFMLDQARSTVATADLECNGSIDSIVVSHVNVAGVTVAQLRIGNRVPHIFRKLDGLPTLIESVDIDGDGVRDVILALIDESTVLPLVVRVTPTEIRSFDERALNWRQLQYVWAEGDDQDSCSAIVAPRSEIGTAGHRYVRVRVSLGGVSCAKAPSIALIVQDGLLRVDSLQTRRLRAER